MTKLIYSSSAGMIIAEKSLDKCPECNSEITSRNLSWIKIKFKNNNMYSEERTFNCTNPKCKFYKEPDIKWLTVNEIIEKSRDLSDFEFQEQYFCEYEPEEEKKKL